MHQLQDLLFNQFIADQLLSSSDQILMPQWATRRKMQYA
jgi:hypothetical protein